MKRRSTIVLITIAIIVFGVFTYYSSSPTDADKRTNSIVIDKNGEVIEPLNEEIDNLGH